MNTAADTPRGWTLLWSSRWYCKARSPEGYPCRLKRGHDGNHIPRKGKGRAWG
jgi:hypothetical protein